MLSLKHVKTLPFASVYLHTEFQNNGQQLAHLNEWGVFSLALRRIRDSRTWTFSLDPSKNDAKQFSLKQPICCQGSLQGREWPTTDFHQQTLVELAPVSRAKTRMARQFYTKCRIQIFGRSLFPQQFNFSKWIIQQYRRRFHFMSDVLMTNHDF